MDPKVVFDRPLENILNQRLEELENDRTLFSTVVACVFLLIGIIGIWLHGLNVSRLIKLNSILPPGVVTLHVHLALANLGVIIACPFGALSTFYNQWLFGPVGCQIYAFEGMICGMTTIALTCSICVLQWIDVKYGYKPTIWFHRAVVILSWTFGLAWSAPPLFGYGKYSLDPHKTTCGLQMPPADRDAQLYLATLTMLGYVIPVSVSTLTYMNVVKYYCKEVAHHEIKGNDTKGLEKFGTEVKLNGWILVQNIVTWLALGVLAFWSFSFGLSNVSSQVYYIPQLMAKLGCATTPVVYWITMYHLPKPRTDGVVGKDD